MCGFKKPHMANRYVYRDKSMFYITKENVPDLLLGSNFLGTGGGPPFDMQKNVFTSILKSEKKICVQQAKDFKEGDFLATVYGVGAASSIHITPMLIRNSLKAYEKLTGIKIKGIIPGEIGGEFLAAQAAAIAKLPIVDSDLVGGRAAPEIQMDVFSVYELPLTPVYCGSANEKQMLLNGKFSAQEIEGISRGFFEANGGDGILVGYPIAAGHYARVAINGTVSRAIKVGEYLSRKDLNGLLEYVGGYLIAKERVEKVTLQSKDGFLKGFITLENFKIWVKNEHIILWNGKKKKVVAPDGIALLDSSYTPIHNSNIQEYIGEEVSIVSFPAIGYWKNKKNKKLWDSAFG